MHERRVPRPAAILMPAAAGSLAVMSTLHLSGVVGGGTPSASPSPGSWSG